jgi:hypothetical protein
MRNMHWVTFLLTATLLSGCAAAGGTSNSSTVTGSNSSSEDTAPDTSGYDASGACARLSAQGTAADPAELVDALGFDLPLAANCVFTYDPKLTPGHVLYQVVFEGQGVVDAWVDLLAAQGWTITTDPGGTKNGGTYADATVTIVTTTDPSAILPPTSTATVDFSS